MRKKIARFLELCWLWLKRTLWYVFGLCWVLHLFVLLMLQFPPVQTKLGEYGAVWLSKKIGYPLSIERISIDWFDEINLRGVSIRDPRKKPLIEVNELIINYRFHTLLNDNEDIYLEKVVINGAIITLVQEGDSLNIDGFINAIDRLTTSSDTTRHPTAESSFQIARAIVRNTRFSYTDSAFMYSEPPDIFNPSHFAFNYINADVSNFIIVADTVQLEVSGLKASEERSKLHIKKLSSFVRYCRKGLDFYGLVANVGNSLLKDTLELRYNHPSDFVHFNQKIKLRACLKQSVIDMADLAKFNPEMAAYQDIGKISAKVTGTVDNIQLKDTHLVFGTGSTLRGNLHFVGLPDIDKLWMHLDLYQTILKSEDILQYVPVSAQETIAHLGTTLVKAKLIGYPNNLSIKGDFQTALGFVRTNITLKSDKEEYNGFVETRDFDIGKISGTSTLGKLTVLGNFQGKGFSLDNANLMAHADVKKLGLMGYDYTNISLDSSYLEKKRFKGSLDINDPNIKLSLKGNINFEDSTFRFTAKIDTAQLHRLNITDDSIAFSTTIKADFEGLIPDQIVGKLLVKDSRLIYKGKSFVLNLLNINTYRDPQRINRKLIVESDLLNMKLDGKFEFVQLAKDIRMLSKEFLLDVWESDSLMNAYYAEKIKSVEKALAEGLIKPDSLREDQDYKLTFDVKVHNINKLFKFLEKNLYVSRGTVIKGSFGTGKNTLANMTLKCDSLLIGNLHFFKNNLNFFGTKQELNRRFNIEFLLTSEKQKIGNLFFQNFSLDGYRLEENFLLSANVRNAQSSDTVSLQTYLSILDDRYEIFIHDTRFQFLEQLWSNAVVGKNKITYMNDTFYLEEVGFQSGNQSFQIQGIVADNKKDSLQVRLQNVDLRILQPYTSFELSGLLTTEAKLYSLYENPQIISKSFIKNFAIDKFMVGNIEAKTEWNDVQEQLILDAAAYEPSNPSLPPLLEIDGVYAYNAPENEQLSMKIFFNKTPMNIFEPFIRENVSQLTGVIHGEVLVKGSFNDLQLNGLAEVTDGGFKINYLNTYYTFSDKIRFNTRSITLKNFKLYDINQNVATLSGGLLWSKKKGYEVNLKADYKEFMMLNTTVKENPIFYGTAIATGNLSIKGKIDDVLIKVNAKSERNTKIFMPLTATEEIEEQQFIRYVSKTKNQLSDSLSQNHSPTEELGFRLELNIEVTPDAYCEIIFDKKTGDIIRGNGKGKLQVLMNNTGDFSMYGEVEIVKGAYNFTMMNLVDKRFDILPNSKISWSGNPFDGKMNVTAAYSQPTSLIPIITVADSSFLAQPEVRRRYPVKVLLNLQGGFFNPSISFSIKISDYPQALLRTYVEAFERRLEVDEQELNRQVFSLIILKKLSPEQRFASVGNAAGNSVSELLTNQLSYWLSQVDNKLEIDVNLAGLTPDALSAMQVRLSYAFMEGRLRITRDGNFTNATNRTDVNSVVGNWTIEYMIQPDGTVRLKLFHKNNTNVLNAALGTTTTTGMSLMHTKSFRSFGELFKRKKKTISIVPPDEEEENQPEPEAVRQENTLSKDD